MAKLVEDILYLEFSDFPDDYAPYLWTGCKRFRQGKGKSYANIPNPEKQSAVLIRYDSVPLATLKKYNILPAEVIIEQLSQKGLKDYIRIDLEDMKYYLETDVHQEAREYAWLAAWCRFLAIISNRKAKVLGFNSLQHCLESAITIIKEDIKVRKIENWRVLGRYLKPFNGAKKGSEEYFLALENLINRRNTTRIPYKRNEVSNRIIVSLYMNLGSDVKLPERTIFYTYNSIAKGDKIAVDPDTAEIITDREMVKGLQVLSIQTIRNTITPAVQAFAALYRDGSKYANDKYRPYVHGQKPKFGYSLSSSDGQSAPYRLKWQGQDSYKRVVVYMVFDVASEVMIGMSISDKVKVENPKKKSEKMWVLEGESIDLMRRAFSDMLRFTDGICPNENQLDNHSKGFGKELEEIYPILSYSEPLNPQSKFAENYIGRFEQEQCRFVEGWLGGNIQDKKQIQKRNPDLATRSYTIEEIRVLYAKMRHDWNNTVPIGSKTGLSRLETLRKNPNPEIMKLPEVSLVWWVGEVRKDKIHRGYIDIDYETEELEYFIPDYAEVLTNLKDWTVRVRFMPETRHKKAWIYEIIDKDLPHLDVLICEVEAMEYTQRSKAERTEADARKLAKHAEAKASYDKHAREFGARFGAIATVSVSSEQLTMNSEQLAVNSEEVTVNSEELTMTVDEAEAVLSQGYTEKHLMQQAEEVLTIPAPVKKYSRWDF